MIVNPAQLKLMLGISDEVTPEEEAVLTQIHPEAESKVIEILGYDPQQRTRTEYYPRHYPGGGTALPIGGFWDVNAQRTHAQWTPAYGVAKDSLQLLNIPLRNISELRIDYNGRFGKGADAFPADSVKTDGEDYWGTWDEDNLCKSGIVQARGTWPYEPGSVKVTYTAGYSETELHGRARTTNVTDGVYTNAGVNAAAISRAVIQTVVVAMNTWAQWKKKATTGFTAGPLKSEKLGDYSYAADGAFLTALGFAVPPAAAEGLEEFQHYGLMRT
jgi:hypothetical protein